MRWVLVAMLSVGCLGKEVDTAFPEGLEPLEENTASWPATLSESISTTGGDSGDYQWGHARAYVQAGITDVYPCLREEMVNADRREVASWTRDDDVEDGYEHSYRLNFLVENIIDLEFSDTWRHGSSVDEQGAVTEIRSRWKMTEGNDFMFLKEGSIVSATPEAGWTSLDIVGYIDVAQGDEETMISYITDMYTDIVVCVSGATYQSFE